MATLIDSPYKCTFIHAPKGGGNSITYWMKENFDARITKRRQHATVKQVKEGMHSLGPIDDLGWTFTVVRNPWDYMVSWYEFKRFLAIERIKTLEANPRLINPNKHKLNLEGNKEILKNLNQGFEWWLMRMNRDLQLKWADDCDYVIKLENLEEDFKEVQRRLNCYNSLPHLNKTTVRKKNYKEYYTSQEMIDYVAEKYSKDIERFGYEF